MIELLDRDLRAALRAEAYRLPVLLTPGELHDRLRVDGRRRGWHWLGLVAATSAILLAAAAAWAPLGGGPGPVQTPTVGGIELHLRATAEGCPSTGGCGYVLELDGEGRHDRVGMGGGAPLDEAPGEPLTKFGLELNSRLAPLGPGSYSVRLSSVTYTDGRLAGEPGREAPLASCSTDFEIDARRERALILTATFSGATCTAATTTIALASQPPYTLDCGPINPERCRERANEMVALALQRYPGDYVISITYRSEDGDVDVLLSNGTGFSVDIN